MLIFVLESEIRGGTVRERGGWEMPVYHLFRKKKKYNKSNMKQLFASNGTIPAAPCVRYYFIFIMFSQYFKNIVAISDI